MVFTKRLSTREVKHYLEQYGYQVPPNFRYVNNKTKMGLYDTKSNEYVDLSLNYIKNYHVSTLGRTDVYQDFMQSVPKPRRDSPIQSIRTPQQRFVERLKLQNRYQDEQNEIYNRFQDIVSKLSKRQNFNIKIESLTDYDSILLAFNQMMSKVGQKVRLRIVDDDGRISFAHLNQNTIHLLSMMLEDERYVNDSSDVLIRTFQRVNNITVGFIDSNPTSTPIRSPRRTGYFVPYLNKSDIDLTKFGIFNNINHASINQSCIYTALYHSNKLTVDELNMMRSFIKTRGFLMTDLKEVCELLNICIKVREVKVRAGSDKHGIDIHYFGPPSIISELPKNGPSVLRSKAPKHNPQYFRDKSIESNLRLIEIYLFRYMRGTHPFSHYMLDELLESNVTIYTTKSRSLILLIPLMIMNGMLEPMSDNMLNKLDYSFEQYKDLDYNHSRPIIIPTKKYIESTYKPEIYGQFYFGF
jgi:hypothetical protein